MRRLFLASTFAIAAAFAPSAAAAQAADGPARIAITAAPPAWLTGAPTAAAADQPRDVEGEGVPAATAAMRRADRRTGTTLMIVGLAGVLTGLLVDEGAITVLGAVVGGVGMYLYLR